MLLQMMSWLFGMSKGSSNTKEEVTNILQSIRTSFIQIYTNLRTLSNTLHQTYDQFQELDEIDLAKTYQQSLDDIDTMLKQWRATAKMLEFDPSIPESNKTLIKNEFAAVSSVTELPDTVKRILNELEVTKAGSSSSEMSGLIAGQVVTYLMDSHLDAIMSSVTTAISYSGLSGAHHGSTAGALLSMALGPDYKTQDLEELKPKYSATHHNLLAQLASLEQNVATAQLALIRIIG